MAAIVPGILVIQDVYQYDLFDISFDIEGINLTDKTLRCQVREEAGTTIVLDFNEDDGSLSKTIVSTTKTSVRLLKDSADMDVAEGTYMFTIIMFVDDADIDDIQTIVKGTITILAQITVLP